MFDAIKLLSLLLFCTSCGDGSNQSNIEDRELVQFDKVEIQSISELPPLSGYLETWIFFDVETSEEGNQRIFMRHFKPNQIIPSVGNICSFTAEKKPIVGVTAVGSIDQELIALVANSIRCY